MRLKTPSSHRLCKSDSIYACLETKTQIDKPDDDYVSLEKAKSSQITLLFLPQSLHWLRKKESKMDPPAQNKLTGHLFRI